MSTEREQEERIERAARAARRVYQPDPRNPGLAEVDAHDAAARSLRGSKKYDRPKELRADIARAIRRAGI